MDKTIVLFGLLLLLTACSESECPMETYRVGNRCLPLPTRPDASTIEDDASTIEDDAGTPPDDDACTPRTYYRDSDEDGHGDPDSIMSACIPPSGYVETNDDCNDDCPTCFEGAVELCDEIDQDCDDSVDEELPGVVSYIDFDGDGYGESSTMQSSCAVPEGRITTPGDCDDRSSSAHPDATEACNRVDDDCDGQIDEGVTITIYRDADGDGVGVQSDSRQACDAYAGFSRMFGDCNDEPGLQGARAYPGANETCDGIDNDCNDSIDEGVTSTYYADCDRDGYAVTTTGSYAACGPRVSGPTSCPSGGWTTLAPGSETTDCRDTDAMAFPGNTAWHTTSTGVSWDRNCDGRSELQYPQVRFLGCSIKAGACIRTSGWRDSVPACGVMGTYEYCDDSCIDRPMARVQACR